MITDETIRRFAEDNGWREVWRSWNANMLKQGRDVPKDKRDSERLLDQDKKLDIEISFDVIKDFCVWLNGRINY